MVGEAGDHAHHRFGQVRPIRPVGDLEHTPDALAGAQGQQERRTEVDFDGIDMALKRMEGRDVFGKIILRVD